jgi:hypothetical protein
MTATAPTFRSEVVKPRPEKWADTSTTFNLLTELSFELDPALFYEAGSNRATTTMHPSQSPGREGK